MEHEKLISNGPFFYGLKEKMKFRGQNTISNINYTYQIESTPFFFIHLGEMKEPLQLSIPDFRKSLKEIFKNFILDPQAEQLISQLVLEKKLKLDNLINALKDTKNYLGKEGLRQVMLNISRVVDIEIDEWEYTTFCFYIKAKDNRKLQKIWDDIIEIFLKHIDRKALKKIHIWVEPWK